MISENISMMLRLVGFGSPNLVRILTNLRTKAVRKGIWFQATTYEERVLTGLIRNYIKIVKNSAVATVIARIIGKLIHAINNSFYAKIELQGRSVAQLWAKPATAMGWQNASSWIENKDVVRWFGLNCHYSSKIIGGI